MRSAAGRGIADSAGGADPLQLLGECLRVGETDPSVQQGPVNRLNGCPRVHQDCDDNVLGHRKSDHGHEYGHELKSYKANWVFLPIVYLYGESTGIDDGEIVNDGYRVS